MSANYEPARLISYVVASDNGLAPNVTDDVCTLTVCKPVVRRISTVGQDWVLGLSTAEHGRNRLIYAMQVDEKVPYEDYFDDPRFNGKKPDVDFKGDNFFAVQDGTLQIMFNQAAHFGKADKIARDVKSPWAVVGKRFWYFGANAPELPTELHETKVALPDRSRRGHRITTDQDTIDIFTKWISQFPEGVNGIPRDLPEAQTVQGGQWHAQAQRLQP